MFWTRVFKIIVVETFEKLNIDFRDWKFESHKHDIEYIESVLSNNDTVNLLMETTVTSQIFAQFKKSKLANGYLIHDNAERHYAIAREHILSWKKGVKILKGINEKYKQVDFVINRIEYNKEIGKWTYSNQPVLMEAKRARQFVFKNGQYIEKKNRNQLIKEIQNDIRHLKFMHNIKNIDPKTFPFEKVDCFFTWLLIWDFENTERSKAEENATKTIKKILGKNYTDEALEGIGWMWNPKATGKSTDIGHLWYLLYEIRNPQYNDKNKKWPSFPRDMRTVTQ